MNKNISKFGIKYYLVDPGISTKLKYDEYKNYTYMSFTQSILLKGQKNTLSAAEKSDWLYMRNDNVTNG